MFFDLAKKSKLHNVCNPPLVLESPPQLNFNQYDLVEFTKNTPPTPQARLLSYEAPLKKMGFSLPKQ